MIKVCDAHTVDHRQGAAGKRCESEAENRTNIGFTRIKHDVFIHGAGGIGQTYPGSCGDAPGNKYFDPTILHNGKFEQTKGYCTDVFYGQATQWMDSQRKAGKPFFCYIPSNAPHAPYNARPEDKALYDGKAPNDQAASFLGMFFGDGVFGGGRSRGPRGGQDAAVGISLTLPGAA